MRALYQMVSPNVGTSTSIRWLLTKGRGISVTGLI
jgi:hypothetical protein